METLLTSSHISALILRSQVLLPLLRPNVGDLAAEAICHAYEGSKKALEPVKISARNDSTASYLNPAQIAHKSHLDIEGGKRSR